MGFHQTDTRPKYDLQPVTETPEVKKAREEHERLWKEAARMNGVDVDANGLYNTNLDTTDDDNDDDELEGQVSNQHQSLTRYPVLPYSKHLTSKNAEEFGRVAGDDSVIVDASTENQIRSRFARQQQQQVEEVTSEPRGFFYSFDYPVPFLRSHAAQEFSQQSTNVVERIAHAKRDVVAAHAGENLTTARDTKLIPAFSAAAEEPAPPKQVRKVNRSVATAVNRTGRGSIKFKNTLH